MSGGDGRRQTEQGIVLSSTKSHPFSELQLTLTPAPPELAQQIHKPDLFSISHSSSSTMQLCILSLFESFQIFEKFIILSDLLLCVLRVLSKHCNSLSSTLWPVRDTLLSVNLIYRKGCTGIGLMQPA